MSSMNSWKKIVEPANILEPGQDAGRQGRCVKLMTHYELNNCTKLSNVIDIMNSLTRCVGINMQKGHFI